MITSGEGCIVLCAERYFDKLRLMRNQGRTVVVFAHKESVLAAVSHLLILSDGRQAAFGPKRDVLSDFLKSRKAKFGLNQSAPVREASDVA